MPHNSHPSAETFPLLDTVNESNLQLPQPPQEEIIINSAVGDHSLPMYEVIPEFLAAVHENSVVLLVGGTGGGKTSQGAQHIATAQVYDIATGEYRPLFDRVEWTQPRVVAANELRDFIAAQISDKLQIDGKELVGVHTGHNKELSPRNELMLCTDGIQTNQLLNEQPRPGNQAIVLDEVHERTLEGDTNMALVKEELRKNPNLRLVIATATPEVEKMTDYFADVNNGKPVPVITVPRRNKTVTVIEATGNFFEEVAQYAKEGVLGILAGKGEIQWADEEISTLLEAADDTTPVFHLHGDQTLAEQSKALEYNDTPTVTLATNIATTSLTPKGKKYVVLSGVERTPEVNEKGVEVLKLRRISNASREQAIGRVGRITDGFAIDAPLPGIYSDIAKEDSDAFDKPAIRRVFLDGLMLKLLASGRNIHDMGYLDPPTYTATSLGELRLKRLNALSSDGEITETGYEMSRIALSPSLARMTVEAYRESTALGLQMIAASAIQESKGIVHREYEDDETPPWLRFSPEEHRSTILQELDVFFEIQNREIASGRELYQHGILVRHLHRAQATFRKVCADLGLSDYKLTKPDDAQRQRLYHAIITGSTDGIFVRGEKGYSHDGINTWRVDKHGATNTGARILVGQALGIETAGKLGIQTRWIINGATEVSVPQLRAGMGHRITEQKSHKFRIAHDRISEWTKLYVDGIRTGIDGLQQVTEQDAPLRDYLAKQFMTSGRLAGLADKLTDLQTRSPSDIAGDVVETLKEHIAEHMPTSITTPSAMRRYIDEASELDIEKFVPRATIESIHERTPDQIRVGKSTYDVSYVGGIAQINECLPGDHAEALAQFTALGTDVDIIDKNMHAPKKSGKNRGRRRREQQ